MMPTDLREGVKHAGRDLIGVSSVRVAEVAAEVLLAHVLQAPSVIAAAGKRAKEECVRRKKIID